ncbi:MAG: hypothetical protein JNM27_16190 [Leptospirales bacterium]|nr:hypothetical protein [Leptospirales bacterium]
MSSVKIKVTAMEGAKYPVQVVTVTGFVPACKEGNAAIDSLRPELERIAAAGYGGPVILDLLDADFTFADHFASLWISPLLMKNCKPMVVADQSTATTIKEMLGGMDIPIVSTLRDALLLC